METTKCWHVLHLQRQETPRLLVKYRFYGDAYEVHISDLSRIWQESLDRAGCIQRATDCGSSIDPSQDAEQLEILLRKIQSAFDSETGTSLDLQFQDEDGRYLSLTVSVTLPKPLEPLKWTIQLQQLDSAQVEAQLVSPILNEAIRLQHQVEQLVGELLNKDRVISKICDRLENSGNDLTTVFPGVSNVKTSRKRGQREQLARHVKGLGDFDEVTWRARSDAIGLEASIEDVEMNAVLGRLRSPDEQHMKVGPKAWWRDLKKRARPSSYEDGTPDKASHDSPMSDRNESFPENGFQRQVAPHHLTQPTFEGAEHLNLDTTENVMRSTGDDDEPMGDGTHDGGSSTEDDEDDLDAPPKRPSQRTPKRQPSVCRSTIPAQVSQESLGQAQVEKPAIVPAPTRRLGAIGGRVDGPPVELSTTQDASSDKDSAAAKPARKLGTFGGRSKEPAPAARATTPAEVGPATTSPTKSRKIGVIGVKGKRETENHAPIEDEMKSSEVESELRARSMDKQATPPPRETSQERADRKRDQLKRELDEKAKVPVKRKRKF